MHSKALLDGFAVFRKHSFARHLFAAAKHNNAVPPVRLRAGGKASSALRGSRGTSDVSKYHATAAASRLFSPAHSSRATDAAGIYSNGFNSTTAATEPSWNASSTFSPPTTGSVCTVLDHGLREVTLQSFADEQYTPQDMCNSTSRSVIYLQHDSDLSACFCNHIVKYIKKILQQDHRGPPGSGGQRRPPREACVCYCTWGRRASSWMRRGDDD